MTTLFDIDEARGRWPRDASLLSADAQAAFAVWSQAPATTVRSALEGDVAWTKPAGSYRKLDKVRDLVLLRTPFPRNIRADGATPLSPTQVSRIGLVADDEDSDDGAPASGSGDPSVADQLAEMRRDLVALQATNAAQQTTIQQLFKAQHVEHTEGDLSSTYAVLDEVLAMLGKDPAKDSCSWMNVLPMTVQERKLSMREHGGTYSSFPPELEMEELTKMKSEIKKASLTLVDFATKEIARYMQRNALTIKMSGTALSRIMEMRKKLDDCLTGDHDEDVVPIVDVINFLEVLEGATGATVELAVDVQTHLRLAVSRRIEIALGVGHLRKDPLKKEKEDFLPPDTYDNIADAAQKKEDLAWAQSRLSSLTTGTGSKHGNPSQKSTGRGNKRGAFSQYKKQPGGNQGRGGGRGKGGGDRSKTPSTPASESSSGGGSSSKKKGDKGKGKKP